jgi:chromosome segregation ATPase
LTDLSKNSLPAVLAGLLFILCLVVAFQWVRNVRLRGEVDALQGKLREKTDLAVSQEAASRKSESELRQLEALRNSLSEQVKSNSQVAASLSRNLEKLESDFLRFRNQVGVYSNALEQANASIRKQNEDVQRQNQGVKKLAEERSQIISRFNSLVKDYNTLAERWNRQQEELARSGLGTTAISTNQ